MTRYHINEHGQIEVCEAQGGNCRYGIGGENHFGSEYEAQAAQLAWRRDHSPLGGGASADLQRGMAAFAGGGGLGSSF